MIPTYISDSNEVPDITEELQDVGGLQITYCGFCINGTAGTDEPKWKIVRYISTTDASGITTQRMFADGSLYFNKIWDNRNTYTYTFKK